MENETRRRVRLYKIIFDLLLLMAVGFPILCLFLWGEAYHRGFFCNDQSLMHPFHESTVSSIYLYVFGIGMTVIVMILTEFLHTFNNSRKQQFTFMKHNLPLWVWNAYCMVGVFLFGAACSQLTTDILKYSIGRFRPHFFTVCMPSINCSIPHNLNKYHIDFYCTNSAYSDTKRILKEMRLSFPSGHSSFSMYCMLYFSIYLHARMTWDGSKLLKHTLQFLAIVSALYTGMTRISDYKHHWSDVLSGLLIGATVASLIARFVGELGKTKKCKYIPVPTQVANYGAILP